jgi:hypothetical protein
MYKNILATISFVTLFISGFAISTSESDSEVKAYSKFVPEREDDFAWENDKVAFRVYGPSSRSPGAISGVDCWLKRVDYSIIDKWYKAHTEGISYHTDWGEGHDPYHVGATRGCGGTAIWIKGNPYPAGSFTAWRIIENEGTRTAFELDYVWNTALGKVQETKSISLTMGSQLFQVNSKFLLNGKPAKNLSIAIGLSTHNGKASIYQDEKIGWIATWEKIAGHHLGTGARVNPDLIDNIIERQSQEKDKSHIWLISHTDEQGQFEYSAGYAWERAGEFDNIQSWKSYLSSDD